MKRSLFIFLTLVAIIIFIVIGFYALKIFKNPVANNNESDIGGSELKLEEIDDRDITPPNFSGVRPDAVRVGDYIYVNYLQLRPARTFRLIKLDLNLNSLSAIDAYSGTHMPSDARMSFDGDGNIWYPFENVIIEDSQNFLNLAKYSVDFATPVLTGHKADAALGSFLNSQHIPAAGTELMDDPTPFFANGKYYVLTKTFSSDLQVRVFSKNFEQIDAYRLNLAETTGGSTISVNSIVKTDSGVVLIAGIFDGPPIDQKSRTAIVAIPLTDDLKTVKGQKIILSQSNEYETYVDSAKYKKGKLYATYSVMPRQINDKNKRGVLKVFDTNNNYQLLAEQQISLGQILDDHKSLELASDKIYVFYYTSEERLRVKTFKLR